jgi:hypothetical protein
MVRHINLDLFFRPQTNLVRARKLLDTWAKLNYIRMTIVGSAVLFDVLWIRIALKS